MAYLSHTPESRQPFATNSLTSVALYAVDPYPERERQKYRSGIFKPLITALKLNGFLIAIISNHWSESFEQGHRSPYLQLILDYTYRLS